MSYYACVCVCVCVCVCARARVCVCLCAYSVLNLIFLLLGINVTTQVTGQNCVSNSSNSAFLDKSLVTAPSWSTIQQDIRWAFLLHAYSFACLFFVLGFYTFFSILNLRYIAMHALMISK